MREGKTFGKVFSFSRSSFSKLFWDGISSIGKPIEKMPSGLLSIAPGRPDAPTFLYFPLSVFFAIDCFCVKL